MTSGNTKGRGARRAGLAGLVAVLGASALFAGGCRSLDKGRLEERLLSLGKNAPASSIGLRRTELLLEVDGSPRALELTYLAAPGPAGAGEDRAPVLLVHGTPSTLFTWVELALGGPGFDGLAAERDVYAIEVVGHGIAGGDASPYGFQRCADFVAAAIAALGLEEVHLVGQSYGGEFAWRAAADHPDRVRSLVVMDSSGYTRRDEDWLPEETVMRESSLAKIGWLLNSEERIESALAPHFRAIPPDRTREFFLCCENAHNWRAMIDLARDENGTRQSDIAGIEVPTLVLWGADDLAYPPDVYARRFADDVPDAELLLLEGTGHYPHEERPAEVAVALNRFFGEHEG